MRASVRYRWRHTRHVLDRCKRAINSSSELLVKWVIYAVDVSHSNIVNSSHPRPASRSELLVRQQQSTSLSLTAVTWATRYLAVSRADISGLVRRTTWPRTSCAQLPPPRTRTSKHQQHFRFLPAQYSVNRERVTLARAFTTQFWRHQQTFIKLL